MCDQSNKQTAPKASTATPTVVSSNFYDPVTIDGIEKRLGQEITEKDRIISVEDKDSKFKGYFGFPRWNEKLKEIKVHTGYDYVATVGETDVKAVHYGQIIQIRFGKTSGECGLLEYFTRTGNLSFKKSDIDEKNKIIRQKNKEIKDETKKLKKEEVQETICYCGEYIDEKGNKCSKDCYGLQVWIELLNISEKRYAFYAHLSELNKEVFQGAISKDSVIDEKHTLVLPTPIIIDGDKPIGKSGDTGNAITETPKHLHFECRTGIEKGDGERISPNRIVKTEFKIKNISDESKPLIEKIEIDHIIEYSMRKKIADEWEKIKSQDKTKEEYEKERIRQIVEEEEKIINSKIEEKKKERKLEDNIKYKLKKELEKSLKNDSKVRQFIDGDGWEKHKQEKKKEYEKKGEPWNAANIKKVFDEWNKGAIDRLIQKANLNQIYDDIANMKESEHIHNEERKKIIKKIKDDYWKTIEKYRADVEAVRKKEKWNSVKGNKSALDEFRNNHKLIVGDIKESNPSNSKPVTNS